MASLYDFRSFANSAQCFHLSTSVFNRKAAIAPNSMLFFNSYFSSVWHYYLFINFTVNVGQSDQWLWELWHLRYHVLQNLDCFIVVLEDIVLVSLAEHFLDFIGDFLEIAVAHSTIMLVLKSLSNWVLEVSSEDFHYLFDLNWLLWTNHFHKF